MSLIFETNKNSDSDPGTYKSWFAKVRFQDLVVLNVPVKKIKTKDGKNFKPVNFEDFNPLEVYSVKTAEFDAEGKAQRYYALIGILAGPGGLKFYVVSWISDVGSV